MPVERCFDFRQAAGQGDRGARERLRQGRAQGIADHRMVVGDQERAWFSGRVGHFDVSPTTKV